MQVRKSNRSEKLLYIGGMAAVVLGLYLSSLHSYLLFHGLVEIITIAIAFTLFILTWNARGFLSNDYLKILGIGYAFIALIDLLHTLAYKGMSVFPGYGANLPTQLWIAARYLQSVTLCAAPLFVERRADNRAIFGGFAAAVSILVAMVYSGNFPDCFIEGKGLTIFKISSEYVITALLLASLYLLYRNRKRFDEKVFLLVASSIASTALSEISFTAYASVYGFANLVGHFAKLAAFYLIYRAILVTGIKAPFDLIFRDLKKAEEALRKSQDTLEEKVRDRTAELRASEARYRSLIHKVQTAIILHDSQGRILDSNPLARELLGLSADQLLGKALIDPAWHFLREDGSVLPVAEYSASLVLSSRQPLRGYVTGISRTDLHDVVWVLINAEPEYNDAGEIAQVIVSFVDITERKRAEQDIALMNFALNHVREAAFLIDEQARLHYVNDEACRVLGYTRAELLGLGVSEVDPDFPMERWPSHWNDLKTQRSLTFEGRHRAKDGRIFPVEISANYFEYIGRAYNLALARDITARKRTEETLHRLNRELRAISDCNQVLVRAEDEQTLLNEICRIICDEAGYRMAWVGYAENDGAKTIRPAAWGGTEDGYLEQARFTWADTERGCGQSGTAIRNGETACIQDFATEPKAALWRERALQRGYRSSIALPLKDESANTFGVLNIYSPEPNAFTPDEIRLMEELAGDLAFGVTVLRTRAERKRVEEALRESEAKTRNILDNIGIGITLISPRMEILEMNRQMREWFPAIDLDQHPLCYRAFNYPPREALCDYCPTCKTLQDGLVHEGTTQTPQNGVIRNYRIVSSPVLGASGEVTAAIELVEDITEKLSLESQFLQAQKMEAVGRLAGGVAHDFNNMLGVIIGRTELALEQVDPGEPLYASLEEIRKAAGRSADLTRQLLAFARKQTVAPRVLDLNETVEGMLKIMRRLIGEDITLAWLPGAGVWPIKIDPSQIDQILANLCVNARDAIAGVGKINIETRAESFDEAYCADHPGFVPGEYVRLAVSDDGCGMDKEVLDKLFEPFFTTKETGKGTGLGLATVYGIVKQNSGFINVYSEPGHGTTLKIYLPRHMATTEEIETKSPATPAPGGDETLLLVEDEAAILGITKIMLERLGYRVLAASTPGEAIRMAKEHPGEIHLLITDVIMPGMNGRDLANALIPLFPGIRNLFMSGYTSNVIAHHGVLDAGVNFVQKPFSTQTLAVKVREALDG